MAIAPAPQQTGPLPDIGQLSFGVSDSRVRKRLVGMLQAMGYTVQTVDGNTIGIEVESASLEFLMDAISSELAAEEFAAIRVRLVSADNGKSAVLSNSEMATAEELIARVESAWLVSLLRDGKLSTFFQPVVQMDSGAVVGYECLLRAFDSLGHSVSPSRAFASASDLDLLPQLDRKARRMAITAAGKSKGEGIFFLNTHPQSSESVADAVRSTLDTASEQGLSPDRIVLELTGSGANADVNRISELCHGYRKAGFRIALDDVEPGFRSLSLVADLLPDFVKLDMRLTRRPSLDSLRQTVTRHVLDRVAKAGVSSVVKGIETADEWDWCRKHGACYAQGLFFAAPLPAVSPEPTNPAFRVDGRSEAAV